MPSISHLGLFCAVLLIQLVGLASVATAQFSERCRARAVCQNVFFVALLGVGVATMLALHMGSASWVSSAVVLGVMAVGGTLDLRPQRRPADSSI